MVTEQVKSLIKYACDGQMSNLANVSELISRIEWQINNRIREFRPRKVSQSDFRTFFSLSPFSFFFPRGVVMHTWLVCEHMQVALQLTTVCLREGIEEKESNRKRRRQ